MKRWGLILSACAASGAAAFGQPGGPPPEEAAPERAEAPSRDPAVVRQRLENHIRELRRQLDRSEAALKAIDEGRPADELAPDAGGPPPPGEGRPGRDGPMSRQDREHIRAFIKENLPLMWKRLETAERGSPQRGDRLLGMMRPRLQELMDLKRRDEQLFQLKLEDTRSFMAALESARTARGLRAKGGGEAEIAAAEAEVREHLARSVDAQLKFKAHEIEALGGRIEELRKELDGLRAERDKVIEDRAGRLLGGDDGPPDDERRGERFRGGRGPRPGSK